MGADTDDNNFSKSRDIREEKLLSSLQGFLAVQLINLPGAACTRPQSEESPQHLVSDHFLWLFSYIKSPFYIVNMVIFLCRQNVTQK